MVKSSLAFNSDYSALFANAIAKFQILAYAVKMHKMNDNRVALIATGDEIISGEIANTNLQHIARSLWSRHFNLGIQLQVSDSEQDLESAIAFALRQHRVVITIGGLGPTLDDRTRFAIAKCMRRPLQFNQVVWDAINRFRARRSLRSLPENNRQQAMFVAGSQILHNQNGTAAGFLARDQAGIVIALPGPPRECLPIFDDQVLPQLLLELKPEHIYRKLWTLRNVSESHIASLAEPLVADLNVELGFRVYKPMLDVKISSRNSVDFTAAKQALDDLFAKSEIDVN